MRSVVPRWIVGVVVAFLLLSAHLRMFTSESVRYYTFWGRRDGVAFALAIAVLGTVFFLGYSLVQRLKRRWLNRAANATFVAVVGLAVVACLRTGGALGTQSWVLPVYIGMTSLVVLLGLGCLSVRLTRIPRVCRAVCLIVSPVVPAVAVQLLTYPDFSMARETLPEPRHAEAGSDDPGESEPQNVYLFVFDEWSYRRTFERHDLAQEFPNLADLVQTATIYSDAHSPHRSTERSLPGILFQTTDAYTYADGEIGFQTEEGVFTPIDRRSSLFSEMKASAYETYLVGWHHPYRSMFGDELGFCWSKPTSRLGSTSESMVRKVFRTLSFGLGESTIAIPKPKAFQWRLKRLCDHAGSARMVATTKRIHELALTIIERAEKRSLAVFHYGVPHWPFVYERDGLNPSAATERPLHFRRSDDAGQIGPNPDHYIARYSGNLRYTDTLIGELTEALKSAGRFDSSLLILTSDHTWRKDPELDANATLVELTHVPLIIKHPYQVTAEVISEPFSLTTLRQFLPTLERTEHAESSRHDQATEREGT